MLVEPCLCSSIYSLGVSQGTVWKREHWGAWERGRSDREEFNPEWKGEEFNG